MIFFHFKSKSKKNERKHKKHEKVTTEKWSFHGSEAAQRTRHEMMNDTDHNNYLQLLKTTNILKHFMANKVKHIKKKH